MPEVFLDSPAGTVTSGGTDAPAAGTSESWTVTVTAAFGEANASAAPATWFHGSDPAAPSEVFLVTANPGGTGTGQSWTVTRGADGTTPVTHATGFSITQVIPAGYLNSAVAVTVQTTGTQEIDSTDQDVIDGLSVTLPAGQYRFRAVVYYTSSSTNDAYITMGGTATASAFNAMICYAGSSQVTSRQQTTLGTNTNLFSTSMNNPAGYLCYIDGTITISAGGTLTVNGASSADASSYTTQAGSLLEVWQMPGAS